MITKMDKYCLNTYTLIINSNCNKELEEKLKKKIILNAL